VSVIQFLIIPGELKSVVGLRKKHLSKSDLHSSHLSQYAAARIYMYLESHCYISRTVGAMSFQTCCIKTAELFDIHILHEMNCMTISDQAYSRPKIDDFGH